MNKERLLKLINYLEENSETIRPTFNMSDYGACLIFHLPKIFPEDWEYRHLFKEVTTNYIRATPKKFEHYCPTLVMESAHNLMGTNKGDYPDLFSGRNNFDQQIEYLKTLIQD